MALQHGVRTNPNTVVPIQNNRVIWNLIPGDQHISIDWNNQRIVIARPGGGTEDVPVTEYSRDTAFTEGFFVYLGTKLFRIATDFISSNLTTVDESLAADITAGRLVEVSGDGITSVETDGLTVQGDGSTSNPLHATQIIFNSMPTIPQLEAMQMPDKTRFLVRGTDTGSGGVMPSGEIQQYTYVYRMDEVKLHPEGWSDHLKNMMTIDAPWAIPIIAANEAAGRGRYAGIKVSIQVPDYLEPQMQNMLGLNVDINEPLSGSWWEDFKDVRSERGGYEASYLKPEGIYNFTFNDSVNSWAQVWRVDNDGMFRAGGDN